MITVLGIGPGDESLMLVGTYHVLAEADVVIGATRQLETLQVPDSKAMLLPPLAQLEEYLREHMSENVVVLASGDPLQYGIGNWMVKRFPTSPVKIIPGISSIQYFFHQLKLPMNDIYITSSHGRVPDFDFILAHQTVGMVTDKRIGPYEIAQAIKERKQHRQIFVGERLSYPDEQVSRYTGSNGPTTGLSTKCGGDLNVKDEEFIRTKVPMTKQDVRAISIDRLQLNDGQHFLDIGSGTGSVSIQVAKTLPNASVTAVEHKQDAIDIMQQNIEHFDLHNIQLVQGEAPKDIPNREYDAIFIGGSGSELADIIEFAQNHIRLGGQIVMNFILLENALTAVQTCEQLGMTDVAFTNITVGNWHGLGKGHFFKMNNPTFILSATGKEGK